MGAAGPARARAAAPPAPACAPVDGNGHQTHIRHACKHSTASSCTAHLLHIHMIESVGAAQVGHMRPRHRPHRPRHPTPPFSATCHSTPPTPNQPTQLPTKGKQHVHIGPTCHWAPRSPPTQTIHPPMKTTPLQTMATSAKHPHLPLGGECGPEAALLRRRQLAARAARELGVKVGPPQLVLAAQVAQLGARAASGGQGLGLQWRVRRGKQGCMRG